MTTALLATLLCGAAASVPLTLDDALAEAARASTDVQLARAQRDAAGVDAYASYAGVLPRLDLNAAFGHDFSGARRFVTLVPNLTFDPVTGAPNLSFQQRVVETPATDFADHVLGFTLQLPLFDGARNWNGISRARSAARAADRQLDETSLGIAFEVTRRFFEVVKAEESLRVLEETAARSQVIVRRADALFEAGRGPRADALAARVNLANDRIAVEQQRARVVQVGADLAAILGRTADTPLSVVAPASVSGPLLPDAGEPPPEADLLARARQARPVLAARAQDVRTADLDRSIAHGAWFPVIGAQATYARQGPELTGSDGVYGDPARQYAANAQLFVQWNLFNGRQTLADEQRAEVAARRARIQAAQTEQQVSVEIARARANVVAMARAAALAADSLAAAEQGVRLATERLSAGATSQLEVRDASLKLTQARLTLVNARIDHVVARADLGRAIGGDL
jgi:outer membrane protein TolC